MQFEYLMSRASGPAWNDCHYLGFRWDARHGMLEDTSDCWVVQSQPGRVDAVLNTAGWFTGLWRAPTGEVFASTFDRLLLNPDPRPRAAPWQTFETGVTVAGIWGHDAGLVLAWGRRGGADVVLRWDGRAWTELPSPGGVRAIHGASPELVYAVGERGLVARWNGHRDWDTIDPPTHAVLQDVFVASEDEMYAVGTDDTVYEGSVFGWAPVVRHGGELACVARWRDRVWVGSPDDGLLELRGGALVPVKPNVKPATFDARWDLVMGCGDAVVSTADGATFTGALRPSLVTLLGDTEPLWL